MLKILALNKYENQMKDARIFLRTAGHHLISFKEGYWAAK